MKRAAVDCVWNHNTNCYEGTTDIYVQKDVSLEIAPKSSQWKAERVVTIKDVKYVLKPGTLDLYDYEAYKEGRAVKRGQLVKHNDKYTFVES
jgi:hypothetical protein